ncbi:MAG: substrate-binding domain-containing protein [Chloroflexota bacterium]
MSDSASRSKRSTRKTLGLISTGLPPTHAGRQWLGMVAMARQQDVNLVAYVDATIESADSMAASELFELAHEGRPDGLIVWADVLSTEAEQKSLDDFVTRYLTVPVICSQKTVPEAAFLPVDGADDSRGMCQAVTHLIEAHHCRRIVFLPGPENHRSAVERYRGYCDALAQAEIAHDPRLVAESPHSWEENDESLAARIDRLRLKPGKDYDALVGCSHGMALAAMRVLQQRGTVIPGQVAVVGFGDAPENLTCNPSLTTVSPPLYEIGQHAVTMLLDRLDGQPATDEHPAAAQSVQLMVRQSCGCQEALVMEAALPLHSRPPTLLAGGLAGLVSKKEGWIGNIEQAFLAHAGSGVHRKAAGELAGEIRYLVDAFLSEATGKATGKAEGAFLKTLRSLLYQTMHLDGNQNAWQAVVSSLRQFLLPYLDTKSAPVCENLWNQARVMIGEFAGRAQLKYLLQQEQTVFLQQEFATNLIAASSADEIVSALADALPKLAISGCYVALYADAAGPSGWAQLILASDGEKRHALPERGVLFPAKQLIPDAYFPVKRAVSLIVKPLHFQDTALGFAVFEPGPADARLYERLCLQLSSALYKAKLMQAEQAARAQTERDLRQEKYLFDSLMQSLPDEIYFKDRESRFIHVNPAMMRHHGVQDASTLLGKTDFDLFDEAHARPAFEDEQRIMETGKPLLDYEEKEVYSDGRVKWVYTSKMPLVDARGEVVGTYGISRDITSRKLIEIQLERRSVQLQTSAEVARAAGSMLDLNDLLPQVVTLIQQRFDLYYVGLFLVDESGEWTNEPNRWAVLRAGTGNAGQQMLAQGHKLELGDTSMIGWCVRNRQPRVALDVGLDAVRFRNPLLPLTHSELALPLISRGQVLGALSVQSEQKDAFMEEDITIFQLMADQLANAIANARLYETTQEALREMEATNRRYVQQGWERYARMSENLGYRQTEQGVQPLARKTLPEVRQAVTSQQSITIQEDASTLVVPIMLRDQAIGAIGFRADQPDRRWTNDEIAVIEVLTEQFALAAENLRLLDETQRRAERERLTANITSHLRESLNVETILKTTVQDIQQALGLSEVVVRLQPPVDSQAEGAEKAAQPVTDTSTEAETKGNES